MTGRLTPEDYYVRRVVNSYGVPGGPESTAGRARHALGPLIRRWAGPYFLAFPLSGSIAKGTAISIGTDADIFISLSHKVPGTLADMYWSLYYYLAMNGLEPRRQNVSVGINYGGLKIDLIPGRRQIGPSSDHSLFRTKAHTWTQTNVQTHTAHVKTSGRTRDIRALKIWRELHGLTFPSFYLELICIRALEGQPLAGYFSDKLRRALTFIAENLESVRVTDPANTANIISDELTLTEKRTIMAQASRTLAKRSWEEVIWQSARLA